MAKKPRRPKRVSFELVERDSVIGHPMYERLDTIVLAHHDEIRHARIALAWCTSWQPDVDGRVTLGKCKKASDLDRELAAYDFVILLSQRFWRDERVTDEQRTALLDHELCHAARTYAKNGDEVFDERGRPVFRVRKHDLEEFTEIVARHGCYKADIERFAAALRKEELPAFKPCEQCKESPGWVSVVDLVGTGRVTRCPCFLTWSEKRALQQSA